MRIAIVGGGEIGFALAQALSVQQHDVFVACTGLDEVNIVSCVVARQVGARETICFVSREDFLDLPQDARGLKAFGIDRVIWPEAQLAEDIERIVRAPAALDAESFAGGAIELVEYR